MRAALGRQKVSKGGSPKAIVRPLPSIAVEKNRESKLKKWMQRLDEHWEKSVEKVVLRTSEYIPNSIKKIPVFHWALGISVGFHAALLFVNFGLPVIERIWNDKSPIVAVLVNTQTQERPEKEQFIAQVNLQAGGNVDDKVQASTITVRSEDVVVGKLDAKSKAISKEQEQLWSLEQEIQKLQSQIDQKHVLINQKQPKEKNPNTDEEAKKLQMDLAAKIEKELFAYSQRPRKKFIGNNAAASFEAVWVESWQRKVEALGNEYYPEQARGKIRGELIVTAGMRADGSLESVTIDKSSGKKVLDQAAERILRLSAPFEPFNDQLRKHTDILYVTRLWRFGPNGIEQSAISN